MLYTGQSVRDNLRSRDGKRVFYLGKGDTLTSEARDYLQRERIPILPASQAKPEHYILPCGAFAERKPEHYTHLHGHVLVPKTHPRIRFRGALDTLEAELVLCVHLSGGRIRDRLEEVLQLARNLMRWEVLEEPVPETRLWGLTEEEIHLRSHRPQDEYGQPHFMPTGRESLLLLQVNRARCAARAAELAAVRAFTDAWGGAVRTDLLRMANRLSSALYLVMIQLKHMEKEEAGGTSGADRNDP